MPKSELNELNTIINSPALYRILDKHKQFLQKEINRFLRDQDNLRAFGTLCKFDDIDRILRLVKNEITEIKKGDEENG